MRLESLALRQCVKSRRDIALELGGGRDVYDLAALDADEVVMVFGQVLRELETCELVAAGHTSDDTCDLEVHEMPVGRAAGKRRETIGNVPDAHGPARAYEHLDDGAPAGCVPLIDATESGLHQAVQFILQVIG